jgi:hypothetical protein
MFSEVGKHLEWLSAEGNLPLALPQEPARNIECEGRKMEGVHIQSNIVRTPKSLKLYHFQNHFSNRSRLSDCTGSAPFLPVPGLHCRHRRMLRMAND